jgi:hypothetical protein
MLIGSRVGSYEVLGKLGEGGMGEVYRARDTALGRDVALKILPEAFASDPDRLMRFEREARTLASLNHPHIAQVHGIEQDATPSGVSRAIVMELVDGEDLSQRLARGPIPLDEAVPIARQIAEALEAAHEAGIIHRDLKPANIKVRADGTVKVLDFGLAKAGGAGEAGRTGGGGVLDSPTFTSPAVTMQGVILGTAAYMAPEQAKGKPVDKRADIWAFGCVLYEMLTGRRAFAGEDVSDTMAAVLRSDPDWSAVPALPPAISTLLKRCLEKDPRRRVGSMSAVRFVLDAAGDLGSGVPLPATEVPRRRLPWAVVAGALVGGLALGAAALPMWRATAPPSSTGDRLHVLAAIDTVPSGSDTAAVISPDGDKIAYFTHEGVKVRWLTDARARTLVADDDVRQVFWSPDSRWVGYANGGAMVKVSLDGGERIQIASLRGIPGPYNLVAGNAAWFPDDRIVFTTGFSGLLQVTSGNATPVEVTPVANSSEDFHGAFALPDGSVLTSVHRDDVVDSFEIVRGAERTVVYTEPGAALGMPVYSATGHIVFARLGDNVGTWALPFDLAARKVTGPPVQLLEAPRQPSVSRDGQVLVAAMPLQAAGGRVALMTRDGRVDRTFGPSIGSRFVTLELSPDERAVAVPIAEGAAGPLAATNLWVFDLKGDAATQITSGVDVSAGRWLPDGRRMLVETGSQLCMSGDCAGIAIKSPDSADLTPLVPGWGADVSPDGRMLVYTARGEGTEWDIYLKPLEDGGDARPFLVAPGWQMTPRFSPDGRYVAYMTTESGQPQVWVASLSGTGRWRVSDAGGSGPRWHGDGSKIYFARGTAVVEVPFTPGMPPSFGTAVEIFPSGTLLRAPVLRHVYGFDVSRDGQRFLVPKAESAPVPMTVEVVRGWSAGAGRQP